MTKHITVKTAGKLHAQSLGLLTAYQVVDQTSHNEQT